MTTLRGSDQLQYVDKETEAQIVKAAFEGLLGVSGKSSV